MSKEKLLVVLVLPITKEKETPKESTNGKTMSGPATGAYCQGWESIFGAKQEVGEA